MIDIEKELGEWRHFHFDGRRDEEHSGEYLERVSQLDLANYFYERTKKEYESLPKVRGWVARDMDGELNFFGAELGDGSPFYNGDLGVLGNATDNKINISRESGPFGDLNYYDDPVEVELLIRKI